MQRHDNEMTEHLETNTNEKKNSHSSVHQMVARLIREINREQKKNVEKEMKKLYQFKRAQHNATDRRNKKKSQWHLNRLVI